MYLIFFFLREYGLTKKKLFYISKVFLWSNILSHIFRELRFKQRVIIQFTQSAKSLRDNVCSGKKSGPNASLNQAQFLVKTQSHYRLTVHQWTTLPTAQNHLVKPRCTWTAAQSGVPSPKRLGHTLVTRKLNGMNCQIQLDTPSPQRPGHALVISELSGQNCQGWLKTWSPRRPSHALILRRLSGLNHQKGWARIIINKEEKSDERDKK